MEGLLNGIALIQVAVVYRLLSPEKEEPLCEPNEPGD